MSPCGFDLPFLGDESCRTPFHLPFGCVCIYWTFWMFSFDKCLFESLASLLMGLIIIIGVFLLLNYEFPICFGDQALISQPRGQ